MKNLKLLLPIAFLLFSTSASAVTTWVKNTAQTSASTSPSPYDNNNDISETLTITGATALNITITGATETNYDFLYITDSAGNRQTFHGNINTTFTVTGSTITIRFISDYSVTDTGVTVTISDASPPPTMGAFTQRYTTNLKGNLKVIGNTVLQSPNPNSTSYNSELRLFYVNVDSGNGRFNSSSAAINTTEAGVDVSNSRIKWAGLYWQGYLHNDNADAGIDNVYNFSTNQATANTQIPNFIQNHSILFKVNNNTYTSIAPQELGQDREYNRINYVSYKYSAFADITSLLQNNTPNASYTIANIPTRSGRTKDNRYDGLGNYGAWSLVVVYDNNESTAEKTRNMTVFDGYTVLSAANNPNQTINLSGFKTPSNAPNGVDSTLSVFAGEGDRNILGDFALLTNQDGYTYNLPDTSGAGSYFASVIEGVPNRNPIIVNNNGIDIHTTQVGTSGGANRPIRENHTSASVTLGTTQDTFMPSMIAFATELFSPRLCYDYDVRVGSHIKIPSDNREIHTSKWGNDPLTLTMLIRSEISDFPIENSKLNVTFSPSTLNYVNNSSEVSPPDVNVYHPIDEINQPRGQIGIGRGATDTTGGTIGALESTYAKQKFSFAGGRFDGNFDIQVEGTILFDPSGTPVPYVLSTSAPADSPNHISRCATNPIYNPIWVNFNIERPNSNLCDTSDEACRYSLYTQITGKDFNVSITSYKRDGSGAYTVPFDTNTTIELELIDASVFDNNASAGYDSTCEEPRAVGNGAFINFATSSGTPQNRVNVQIPQDIPNFNNNIALQSVAFRLWILTVRETNGTKRVIEHDCTLDGVRPNCFKTLYKDRIKPYDVNTTITGVCQTACEGGGYTAQGCYNCLRENFASPICSRDNFAIRPESFRIKISDNNESNITTKQRLTDNSSSFTNPDQAIAAGYQYAIDVNATLYNTTDNAQAYYNGLFQADSNITNLGSKTKDNVISALEFQTSSGTSCNDKTHRTYALRLQDGQLDDNTYISHNNVGNYNFWMLDNNWTNVDQATYPFKTRFGTCKIGDTRAICTDCDISNPSTSSRNADGKLGCVINSNLNGGDINKDRNYIEIPLRIEPYSYDLSEINITIPNSSNVLYMNNLNTNNIADRAMAVRFNGPLKAMGSKGTLLNNYTANCAARAVAFDINRTLTQNNISLNENSIRSINLESAVPSTKVNFQRYDSSANTNPATQFAIEDNVTNTSTSIIVNAAQFRDDGNGSAILSLEYNFQRPCCQVVNPLLMQFNFKEANSTASTSSAHLTTNYIPEGNATINQNVNFIYGRIAPNSSAIYTVPPSQKTTTIPMFVEAYCNGLDVNGSLIDCRVHTLTKTSQRDANSWWVNTNHNSIQGDGQINVLYEYEAPYPLSIVPDGSSNTPIDLNNPTNITVTINPGAIRPYTTPIVVVPNEPWLGYNPNRVGSISGNPSAVPRPGCVDPRCSGGNSGKDGSGQLDPIVNFQGGGGWAGKGNTGLVVDTNASADTSNKRTSW